MVNIAYLRVLKQTGVQSTDSVRNVIIELFKEKAQLKKIDITDACKAKLNALPASGIYTKVMQELATSRGSVWTFKTSSL